MNLFIEAIRERLNEEHLSLEHAMADHDLYEQEVHEAELENLHRLAMANGMPLEWERPTTRSALSLFGPDQ